jgi:hypothetical protein
MSAVPRPLFAAAAAALIAAASAAFADTPAPDPAQSVACPPFKRLPAPRPGFYPERVRELWLDVSFISDWNLETRQSFPAFGFGFEYLFVFDKDARVRLGPRLGLQIGRWGDNKHASFSLDPGLRFRGSFYMDPIVDVYAIAKTDVLVALGIGQSVQQALRPGLGIGVRLGRAVQIEGTFDVALALGSGFIRDSGTTAWAPGLWLSGGFDLCTLGSFCNAPEPQQVAEDDTGKLYDDAHAVCAGTKDAALHGDLCAAVDAAMDGDRYPPGPEQDSTEAFLAGVQRELDKKGRERLALRIADMAAHHHAMEACRRKNQRDARLAAQKSQRLAVHYNYAPFPVLLRRALGCDGAHLHAGGGDPACPEIVDRPRAAAP